MDKPLSPASAVLLAVWLALPLTGCGTGGQMTRTPADHPASALAPAGAMPEAIDTLAVDAPLQPQPMPIMMDHHKAGDDGGAMGGARDGGGYEGMVMPGEVEPDMHREHQHNPPRPTDETLPLHPIPAGAAMYVCPMHPDVTSVRADARCPQCGMKLEPVAVDESKAQP